MMKTRQKLKNPKKKKKKLTLKHKDKNLDKMKLNVHQQIKMRWKIGDEILSEQIKFFKRFL